MKQKDILNYPLFPYALIFLTIAITFSHFLNFFFIHDDFNLLIKTKYRWNDLISIVTIYNNSFTPVINILLKLIYSFFSYQVEAYYLFMLSLHFLNSCLVYKFALYLTRNKILALVSAIFFAITFSHWEAVYWLAGGLEHMVPTCFVLACNICWFQYLSGQNMKNNYILSVLFFVLALLSKESSMGLIFLLLLQKFFLFTDKERNDKFNFKEWIEPYIVFIVILPVYLFLFRLAVWDSQNFSLLKDPLCAVKSGINYLYMLFLPDATIQYTAPHIMRLSESLYFFMLKFQKFSVPILSIIFIAGFIKGNNLVRFLLTFIVLTIGPVIFIEGRAYRYLYMPSVGFSILVGLFWCFWWKRFKNSFGKTILLSLLVVTFCGNWFAHQMAQKVRVASASHRKVTLEKFLNATKSVPHQTNIALINIPTHRPGGYHDSILLEESFSFFSGRKNIFRMELGKPVCIVCSGGDMLKGSFKLDVGQLINTDDPFM